MLLRTPSALTDPLVEAPLQPAAPEGWAAVRAAGDPVDAARDLPIVSIGRPDSWPVADVYGDDDLPPLVRASLETAEFHLVRFACSFRPGRGGGGIEWARFSVRLLPDKAGRQPVAFDLHPHAQVQEIKRSVRVGIAPTLRFEEADTEASLSVYQRGIEYTELLPVVSGSGIGETTPSWDYEAVRGVIVSGTRCTHALIKAPRGTTCARAALELTADVIGPGFRIPVILRRDKTEEDFIEVDLWG